MKESEFDIPSLSMQVEFFPSMSHVRLDWIKSKSVRVGIGLDLFLLQSQNQKELGLALIYLNFFILTFGTALSIPISTIPMRQDKPLILIPTNVMRRDELLIPIHTLCQDWAGHPDLSRPQLVSSSYVEILLL